MPAERVRSLGGTWPPDRYVRIDTWWGPAAAQAGDEIDRRGQDPGAGQERQQGVAQDGAAQRCRVQGRVRHLERHPVGEGEMGDIAVGGRFG
jgi:hypothetical protein